MRMAPIIIGVAMPVAGLLGTAAVSRPDSYRALIVLRTGALPLVRATIAGLGHRQWQEP